MMRTVVHILSGDLWGGAEAAALGLLTGLASSGLAEPAAVLLNHGVLEERLRKAGIPVDVLSERERTFPSLVRTVRAILAKNGPRVVHSHGYKEDIVAFLATVGGGRRALVRTQHGSPYPAGPWTYRSAYFIDRRVARTFFHAHVAVSAAIASDLARFVPEERIRIIPNGIALPGEEASPPVELPFPPGSWVVASAGRFAREKRYDLLLRAAAHASSRLPELCVLLIGDGPDRGELERIASELLPGKVHFTGFVEDPSRFLRKSMAYLLTSEREGLPVGLLEAMALGLPVVATSVGGVPEVVRHGETGILARPGSVEELAEGILRLARESGEADSMGRRAKELVRKEYSIEKMVRETAALYRDLEGKH